jgi:hypothetical protein
MSRWQILCAGSGGDRPIADRSGWPIDTEQAAREWRRGQESLVDPGRLTYKIGIERACDNARVVGLLGVEPDEVFSIERHDGPALAGREREDDLIGHGLPGLPRFPDGQDIVTQPT